MEVETSEKISPAELNEQFIEDREIERFLKIFSVTVQEPENDLSNEEALDNEDGTIDIIITVAKKISQLLEGDIDSLKFPKVIIKFLKTLRAIVGLVKVPRAKMPRTKVMPRGKRPPSRTVAANSSAINNALLNNPGPSSA